MPDDKLLREYGTYIEPGDKYFDSYRWKTKHMKFFIAVMIILLIYLMVKSFLNKMVQKLIQIFTSCNNHKKPQNSEKSSMSNDFYKAVPL